MRILKNETSWKKDIKNDQKKEDLEKELAAYIYVGNIFFLGNGERKGRERIQERKCEVWSEKEKKLREKEVKEFFVKTMW